MHTLTNTSILKMTQQEHKNMGPCGLGWEKEPEL